MRETEAERERQRDRERKKERECVRVCMIKRSSLTLEKTFTSLTRLGYGISEDRYTVPNETKRVPHSDPDMNSNNPDGRRL